MPVRVGTLELPEQPLLLAPMEDVTDQSFRLLCKRYGADMVFTEFVNADGLIRGARTSVAKLRLADAERPAGIQIYGQHLESMVAAAEMVNEAQPDVIDLNFGCPVKKIAGRGAGAGMLRDVEGLVAMTAAIVRVARYPVTVKTRLGWDAEHIVIGDLAERLQDVGVAMLTVHGRTRAQLYSGRADWEAIAAVRRNPRVRIPIVGNGDIDSARAAKAAFDTYGVDGVMIGRATYGKPWIFREVRHLLETGQELPPAGIAERVEVALEHLQLSLDSKGPGRGIFEIRRHLGCYFKGLPHFKERRLKLLTETDPLALEAMLREIGEVYSDWVPEGDDTNSPWPGVGAGIELGCVGL